VAGAALVVSGCGGVLGTGVSPTITAIIPVKCAIDHAIDENENYGNAVFFKSNSLPFEGNASDDLTKPANRTRIFRQRQAELKRQDPKIAELEPEDDLDEQFVSAVKSDLRDAEALMAFNLKYPPGDPKSPDTDLAVPTALDDLLGASSADVRRQFAACSSPADLARRTKEYGG
jgi:hypothetical protein